MIMLVLLALFVVLPILELVVLLKVHAYVGSLAGTISIIVLTGVVGATLAKAQGMAVVLQIRRDLAEGRMPAPKLVDGLMIIIAGVLMITPGLITDSVGFLLLVPYVREQVRTIVWEKMKAMKSDGVIDVDAHWS